MLPELVIDTILLAMLAVTALAIARTHNLFATAMLAGIFSLLGASWMLYLDAPDVAFTEAAVGAGISTVLILAALCVMPAEEKPSEASPLALMVVLVTGAVLIYGTFDMPRYGDPNSPASRNPVTRAYLYSANPPPDPHAEPAGPANALDAYAVGIPNTVTTVLASFRGYDTMGETAVILTAGLGVLAILRGARHRRYDPEAPVDIEPHDDGLAP